MGKEDRPKMILPVVSSLLLASMALCAPGASYGAATHVSPAKQISSPSIQCRTEYVTLWDRVPRARRASVRNSLREAVRDENPEVVPAHHQAGVHHQLRQGVQHHLQERLRPEVQDRV